MISQLTVAGLETILNRYLQMDPDTPTKLTHLTGKAIAIELSGLEFKLTLLPHAQGIQIVEHYADEPDVVIRGTPLALLSLLQETATDTPNVEIQGDTGLAQALHRLFNGVPIDWEEILSQRIGDLPAHQLGRLVRSSTAWGQQSLATLTRDVGEYLQHEARDLPPRRSLESFIAAVDTLRDDSERLEARIRRLQQNLN